MGWEWGAEGEPASLSSHLATGCAFPYAAYSMPASWLHSRLHQLFVPAAALNSFLCTGLSCYSRWVLGIPSVGQGSQGSPHCF